MSTKFYSAFLGKPTIGKEDVSWKLGDTKLFITGPYKINALEFDKANLGLNHIAFRVSSKKELIAYSQKMDKVKITNSGIKIDKYNKKEFVWFDDPDGIRLEFYRR